MNFRTTRNSARVIIIALSTFALVNVLGILNSIPPAYATTCAQNGGKGQTGHYYAQANDSSTSNYGVAGRINESGWTINTGYNGSSSTSTAFVFNDGYAWPNDHWIQSGLMAGVGDNGQYSYSRIMFWEYNTLVSSGTQFAWQTGDGIPANDKNYAANWANGNSGGYYTYEVYINSTYWNNANLQASISAGTSDTVGTAGAVTENTYGATYNGVYRPYSGSCNSIYYNYQYHLTYSTAVSSQGSWTSWGSSHKTQGTSPYSVSVVSNTEFYEYGS